MQELWASYCPRRLIAQLMVPWSKISRCFWAVLKLLRSNTFDVHVLRNEVAHRLGKEGCTNNKLCKTWLGSSPVWLVNLLALDAGD